MATKICLKQQSSPVKATTDFLEQHVNISTMIWFQVSEHYIDNQIVYFHLITTIMTFVLMLVSLAGDLVD